MATEAEIAVFYSLNIVNTMMENLAKDTAWGTFISPCNEATQASHNPQKKYKTDFTKLLKQNLLLDSIISAITAQEINLLSEHYFSEKYYLDCFNSLRSYTNTIQTIVGVEMDTGNLSDIFAGCLDAMNAKMDLIDSNKERLFEVYQKIARSFPHMAPKIRLFFGDLPTYAKKIIASSQDKYFIHYNGCYGFNDVIRNLGSLYYVKEKVPAITVQNTHLRSTNMHDFAFTDVALFALFGKNLKFSVLGEVQQEETHLADSPIYYLKQHAEGLHIPLSLNVFRYPHPSEKWENFLYKSA